jgi:hypothetical protein
MYKGTEISRVDFIRNILAVKINHQAIADDPDTRALEQCDLLVVFLRPFPLWFFAPFSGSCLKACRFALDLETVSFLLARRYS